MSQQWVAWLGGRMDKDDRRSRRARLLRLEEAPSQHPPRETWAFFGPGWKNFCYFEPKNHAHDRPTWRIGPQFSGRAQVEPGLGRATRAFYSIKQLKTAFRGKLGEKNFAGFKTSAHTRPVRFVGGPEAGRAGLKMLRQWAGGSSRLGTGQDRPRWQVGSTGE
jgi:hypothetical protein